MIDKVLFLLLGIFLFASEIPVWNNIGRSEGVVFFLTTPKSGSNLISGSLSAITRKPVSWLIWREKIFDSKTVLKEHPSYNRLSLPLVSDQPILYRTHYDFSQLIKVNSSCNRLIFATRNPKELLFRSFFLDSEAEFPDQSFIDEFLESYLAAFEVYDQWESENKKIVFYEDFIVRSDEILLELLDFIQEPATYWGDYQLHKEEYLEKLLKSYKTQHVGNRGGSSSRGSPQPIYYTASIRACRQLSHMTEAARYTAARKFLAILS
jgi:hypothetical protein